MDVYPRFYTVIYNTSATDDDIDHPPKDDDRAEDRDDEKQLSCCLQIVIFNLIRVLLEYLGRKGFEKLADRRAA